MKAPMTYGLLTLHDLNDWDNTAWMLRGFKKKVTSYETVGAMKRCFHEDLRRCCAACNALAASDSERNIEWYNNIEWYRDIQNYTESEIQRHSSNLDSLIVASILKSLDPIIRIMCNRPGEQESVTIFTQRPCTMLKRTQPRIYPGPAPTHFAAWQKDAKGDLTCSDPKLHSCHILSESIRIYQISCRSKESSFNCIRDIRDIRDHRWWTAPSSEFLSLFSFTPACRLCTEVGKEPFPSLVADSIGLPLWCSMVQSICANAKIHRR